MGKITKNTLFLCLAAIFCLASSARAKPLAFVTIAPQHYFVDKISGGLVDVETMILPGANPHAYEPKPGQMTRLAKADLYFTIGDSFDTAWLPRLQSINPAMLVVRTEAGVVKMPVGDELAHSELHDQTPRHSHAHGSLDPHIWLDPQLVKIQAQNIKDGLCAIDPKHAEQYQANLGLFLQELDNLDKELRTILTPDPAKQPTFMVFHPSWGYFARAYGLRQMAIEVDGKEPSPKELRAIIDHGQALGIKTIFAQPQFSEKSAAVIAAQLGAQVAHLDPLAPNWADNLRQAAQTIAAGRH